MSTNPFSYFRTKVKDIEIIFHKVIRQGKTGHEGFKRFNYKVGACCAAAILCKSKCHLKYYYFLI